MVEKNKGEAPEAKTKKKSNTEPVQQGFGIFDKYIDCQVDIDNAIKKMQKREKTHGVIIMNSKKNFKPVIGHRSIVAAGLHGCMGYWGNGEMGGWGDGKRAFFHRITRSEIINYYWKKQADTG